MRMVIDDERRFREPALERRVEHFTTSGAGFRRIMRAIEQGEVIEELWLDHDLGGDDTTRDIVTMMVEDAVIFDRPWPIDHVFVHSSNSVGADWIEETLKPYYNVSRIHWPVAYGLIKDMEQDD